MFGSAILMFVDEEKYKPILVDLIEYAVEGTKTRHHYVTKGDDVNSARYLVKLDADGTKFKLGQYVHVREERLSHSPRLSNDKLLNPVVRAPRVRPTSPPLSPIRRSIPATAEVYRNSMLRNSDAVTGHTPERLKTRNLRHILHPRKVSFA